MLLPVVKRLRSRFGIGHVCVVADRGMISAATIAELEAQGIDYILGARERSSKEIRETVLTDDGVSVPLIIPRQKGKAELAVKEVKIADRRRTGRPRHAPRGRDGRVCVDNRSGLKGHGSSRRTALWFGTESFLWFGND